MWGVNTRGAVVCVGFRLIRQTQWAAGGAWDERTWVTSAQLHEESAYISAHTITHTLKCHWVLLCSQFTVTERQLFTGRDMQLTGHIHPKLQLHFRGMFFL